MSIFLQKALCYLQRRQKAIAKRQHHVTLIIFNNYHKCVCPIRPDDKLSSLGSYLMFIIKTDHVKPAYKPLLSDFGAKKTSFYLKDEQRHDKTHLNDISNLIFFTLLYGQL